MAEAWAAAHTPAYGNDRRRPQPGGRTCDHGHGIRCRGQACIAVGGRGAFLAGIVLVSFILENSSPDYQEFIASDINFDGSLDIFDVVDLVIIILNP